MSLRDALSALVRILSIAPRGATLLVLALMLLTGLTEGVGIVMLVPLLQALSPPSAGQVPSALAQWLEWLGVGQAIGPLLVLFLALVLARALLVQWQQVQTTLLINQLVDTLRERCFSAILHAEWRWLTRQQHARFHSMIITNIGRLGVGLLQAANLVAAGISALAFVIAAIALDWRLALTAMLGGALLLLLVSGHRQRVVRLGQTLGKANQALHQHVQEGVAGIRLTRIWQAEAQAERDFVESVRHLRQLQVEHQRSLGWGRVALQFGGALLLVAVVYAGLNLFSLTPVLLLPLALVFVRLVPTLGGLQSAWHHWLHALPALTETEALLADAKAAAEPQVQVGSSAFALHSELRLDNVSVRYTDRDRPSLDGFSAIIKARTTTIITGPSGAGKSTLADVLTGLISPDAGRMLVDDVPVEGAGRLHWRASVSYVQQDAFLFNESVRANLLRANPLADEAALRGALALASADFVMDLPQGLDSPVGDNGVRLSGGERQRIALARALLRNPSLLILDEATSAVDQANELSIQQAIAGLKGRMTIIAITHHGFRDMAADQILTLPAPAS